jgi:pyridoxine/pyridoxamine 5'-phosphate oxidase
MPEPGTLELDLLLPKPLETVRELPSSPSYASCGRAALEADLREVEARYSDRDVPLPPHWGGYRVVPDTIEFWQGRESRTSPGSSG